jgi:carboxyl-terminal processing protease
MRLWDSALHHYLRLYFLHGPDADLSSKICRLLRQVRQVHRCRDLATHVYAEKLSTTETLDLYSEVLEKLSGHYVDRERSSITLLAGYGVEELYQALTLPDFLAEELDTQRIKEFRNHLEQHKTKGLPATVKEARLFARDLASVAVDSLGVTNPNLIVLELIHGACAGLDEFTCFQTPEFVSNDSDLNIVTHLESYGLYVRQVDPDYVVEAISEHSWSEAHTSIAAGMKITDIHFDYVFAPTRIALQLQDPVSGDETGYVYLPVPAPTAFIVNSNRLDPRIGMIRITEFRQNTAKELDHCVRMLTQQGKNALILDLRNNPGGSFSTALAIAERFIPSGVLARTEGQIPEFSERSFHARDSHENWHYPMVVLMDTRSMSAAEVLVASLKESRQDLPIVFVGRPTYGKGTIQVTVPVHLNTTDPPLGFLHVTVARIKTPSGQLLSHSLWPDITILDSNMQLEYAQSELIRLIECH